MTISAAILPEEFYTLTNAQLLVQPEPQYLYTQLFKAALATELNVQDVIGGLPGAGAVTTDYAAADRDRLMLSSPLPGDLFQVKYDFNGSPGHTVKFNRPQFANTVYTQASRQIGINSTISTTPIDVGSEQNTLTIIRVGGPYDTTNSRPAPFAFDAFDASMGVHNLYKIGGVHLKRDFDRFIDAWVSATANNASTTVYPAGMASDNAATSSGMFPFTYEQMSRTSKEMDEADLPTFGDGRRMLVVTPTGKKQLKDDPQYARYSEFHKEMNVLFPAYFGTTPEFHCFLSNTLSKVSNSSSVPIHYGQAFSPGAFMGGMGRPPSVRLASDTNYQETPKVIWLAYLAFGLSDNRFVKSVRYTAD